MKKFFKILGKIIKILLKTILGLILGIFVIIKIGLIIFSIGLVIINNKTLKSYEDEHYNMKFTMSEDFKIEEGKELKINLKNLEIIINEIKDYQIYNKFIYNLKLNEQNDILYYKGGNIYEEKNYKSNNYIIITGYYIDGNIFRVGKIGYGNKRYDYNIYYDENGNIIGTGSESEKEGLFLSLSRNDGSISDNLKYIDGKVNGFRNVYNYIKYNLKEGKLDGKYFEYYYDGNIKEEGNYINGEKNGIRSGYYEDGNIKYSKNYKDGILSGMYLKYYKNGNIKEEGNYINNDLGNYKYYNKLGNFIGSGEIVCLLFSGDNCIEKQMNGLYIEYSEFLNQENISNYKNGKFDGRQFLYFNRSENNKSKQILLEGYFIDGKKIFIIERDLGDYNHIIL